MVEKAPPQPKLVSSEKPINPADWKNYATYMVYADAKGKKNQISLPKLIETKDFQALNPVMQRRVIAMVLENPDIGIGLGGTSRTYEQQLSLFKQRYEPIGTNFDWQANYEKIREGGKFKEWNGQWWRLKPGQAEAATPGNSYHGEGLAVDFVFKNAKARDWLINNAERFGLRNVASSSEPWHYQLAGLPDSLRMTKKLMEEYNWNPLENQLPRNVLEYVNNYVTANAPFRFEDKRLIDRMMASVPQSKPETLETSTNQGGVRRLQSTGDMTMSNGTNNQNQDDFFSRSQQRIEEQRAAEAAAAAAGRPARIIVGPTGRFETYTGPGLVTDDGKILRDSETGQIITEYNLDSDPEQYYRSFSPAARNNLMAKLYKAGFFSVGKPGDFLDELNALKNAMFAGNLFGMDVQHVANARIANMPVQPGTGVRRRVTASEDLKTIAKQVSRQTIGRELSEEQLNRFIASYQGIERAGGVGGQQPMSADVAAQKFTQEQEPIESRGYQYLSYMKDLFSAIGPVGGGSA